jgi:hypothetical protein
MVGTLEGLGVARAFTAHQGATMTTSVQQSAHLVVTAAHQNDWSVSNVARTEITWVRNFRLMTGVDPAAVKDPLFLKLQNLWVGECPTVDAEYSLFAVVHDPTC